MVAVIRVLLACEGSPFAGLMPVVVTAAKELSPGVHSVQVHREQANTPYQNMAKSSP